MMFNLPDRWGKRWLIVGLGITGISCAHFLTRRSQTIYAYDTRVNPPGMELLPRDPGFQAAFENMPNDWLDKVDQLVVSPGLGPDLPVIASARERGLPIVSDIEVFASA
jgi:UDP-N-acetylmuramoylalanine--D-glutamate ligase